jgi:hypothetical protein
LLAVKIQKTIMCCLIIATGCSHAQQPKKITLDQLMDKPEAYVGRRVEVDACVLVDRHGMALADCKSHVAVSGLAFAPHSSQDAKLESFIRKAQSEWLPGRRGVQEATLVGTLSLDDKHMMFVVEDVKK